MSTQSFGRRSARCYAAGMNGELVTVGGALLGLALVIAIAIAYTRRAESRAREMDRIELPLMSTLRSVLVILPAALAAPIGMGILAHLTDPWMRSHAEIGVLGSLAGGTLLIALVAVLTRDFRRVGALTWTRDQIEITNGSVTIDIDLTRPFEVSEGSGFLHSNLLVQVVALTQNERSLVFGYGLPIGRKPYGEKQVSPDGVPLFGSEGRVVHDHLREARARLDASARSARR